MKNLLITLIFVAVLAHLSFAKEKTVEPDYSTMDEYMDNQAGPSGNTQYNQINATAPEKKKTRNKWDFSDHSEDKKKETSVHKKSSNKQEYRRPKKWEPRKSVTTNNVTTSEIAN